jgi:hypothetical protein
VSLQRACTSFDEGRDELYIERWMDDADRGLRVKLATICTVGPSNHDPIETPLWGPWSSDNDEPPIEKGVHFTTAGYSRSDRVRGKDLDGASRTSGLSQFRYTISIMEHCRAAFYCG